MMTYSFYKENNIWYVDLPEYIEAGLGTKDNLMMVAGADTFLDYVCRGKKRVTCNVALEDFQGCQFLLEKKSIGIDKAYLNSVGHPEVEYGAYYTVKENNHQLWLCPVAEYVFNGIYPDNIYIQIHP